MSFCAFSSLCYLVDFLPGFFWISRVDPCSLELLQVILRGGGSDGKEEGMTWGWGEEGGSN